MAGRQSRATAIAVSLWVTAFVFQFWSMDIYNDHFDRIARGRQIARYGELPFRDFLDPGFFLAEFSSAAVQIAFGDNLLGEALLDSAFIASGALLVLLAATQVSGSLVAGVSAAALAVLAIPRPYDYDKFFFYPLGVVLIWRYVERSTPARLAALAGGVVAAAFFRYDAAAYLGGAALVAIACKRAKTPRTLLRQIALFAGSAVLLSVPFLLFVQAHGGLSNALDQMVTYGVREARPLQLVVRDPSSAIGVRLPPHLYASAAGAFLYAVIMVLPLLAAAILVVRQFRARARLADNARLWALIAMCIALNLFILRPPMHARIGGMAGPIAILGAWLALEAWQRRALRVPVLVVSACVVWGVSGAADWTGRLPYRAPIGRLRSQIASLSESPPDPGRLSMGHLSGLTRYLRGCIGPNERVFATWFVPELSFFAQRSFGGRMAATWQWSDMRFQSQSADALRSQRPIVVVQAASYAAFAETYPILARYLDSAYRVERESDFGDPSPEGHRYRVLVPSDRGIAGSRSLPCD